MFVRRALPLAVVVLLSGCLGPATTAAPARTASATTLEVALTVDDLPVHGPLFPGAGRVELAQRFIDAFRRHRLPPVYGFVNGRRAAENPEAGSVLTQWVQSGNRLGNHTYSHVDLNAVTLAAYFSDLMQGEAILDDADPTWRSMKLFRYPFLFEGNTAEKRDGVRGYLRAQSYVTAEVTIEADDWAFNPPFVRCAQQGNAAALQGLRRRFIAVHLAELESMRTLTRALVGRDVRQVLLLHIGSADAEFLDELLTAYEEAGVRWKPLADVLADPFYAIDPGRPFAYGASFPYLVARARGVAAPRPAYNTGIEQELDLLCR